MTPSLYDLLPSLLREQDALQGFPLRALLQVFDQQRSRLYADTQHLHDQSFIDSCNTAGVSGIAALLGLSPEMQPPVVTRAAVAYAQDRRRRKGTMAALQRRIADLTDWQAAPVQETDPPANTAALNLQVFQQTAFWLRGVRPASVGEDCFLLHPLGWETQLFHLPQPQRSPELPLGMEQMPYPIPLDDAPRSEPSLRIIDPAARTENDGKIAVAFTDLTDWDTDGFTVPDTSSAWIDPRTGRLLLPWRTQDDGLPPPLVDFAYGYQPGIGGCPYLRAAETPCAPGDWLAYVHSAAAAQDSQLTPPVFSSLAAAIAALPDVCCPATICLLEAETQTLPEECTLHTSPECCAASAGQRRSVRLEARSGVTPTVHGRLRVPASSNGLDLSLEGIWWRGSLALQGDVRLMLSHCTLQAEDGAKACILAEGAGAGQTVELYRTLCGGVVFSRPGGALRAQDTVLTSVARIAPVDRGTVAAVSVHMVRSTLLQACDLPFTQQDSLIGAPPETFLSIRAGDPGYAQLAPTASSAMSMGASNGAELGAFNYRGNARRNRALQAVLEEYVPLGLPVTVSVTPDAAAAPA